MAIKKHPLIAVPLVIFIACSADSSQPKNEGFDASDEPDAGSETDAENNPAIDAQPEGSIESDVPFTEGVSTLAGWSEAGDIDGPRSIARFYNPVNVAFRNGTVYVADFDNNKLRMIDTATNITSSMNISSLQRPFGLAFASDDVLFVSTDSNPEGLKSETTGTIWRIDLTAKMAKVVKSDMGRPRGITALPDGRIAATDYLHHVVEIIDPQNGQTEIIAGAWDQPGMADGSGADARFSKPYGIGLRSDNMLVVADRENHRIRLVAMDGAVSTFAGSGEKGFSDGSAMASRFNGPVGISIAENDDVFVADTDNYRIRRISNGQVATVAGNGQSGYADDDNPLSAQLFGLEGLAITPDGTMLYVADGNRGEDLPFNRVRQVKLF